MYWQFKLLLAILGIAALGGGIYVSWPNLPRSGSDRASAQIPPAMRQHRLKVSIGTDAAPAAPAQNNFGSQTPELRLAKSCLEKGELLKARDAVRGILNDPELKESGKVWEQAVSLLNESSSQLLFSYAPCPEKEEYVVKPGDSLWKIAKRHKTTIGLLARGNGLSLKNPRIYPDQILRIYRGQWNLKVSKSKFTLTLYDGDRPVKIYKIGIGRQDRTPAGSFTVTLKQKNPTWWAAGKVVPTGDPQNPLGTRWLAVAGANAESHRFKGYGIHGTSEAESIGRASSNGCIRLLNSHVEELYDIIPTGVPIIIED